MKKPLVSIITPSYNQGQFIEDTIKSVLNQTYDNIEYIVIDGASTDNTLFILEKYHSKLKFISEKDTGQSNAINKGFKRAKGEIIGWINSDDILMPDCIESVVKEFNKDQSVGLVYGCISYIDQYGNETSFFGMKKWRIPDVNLDFLLRKKPAIAQPGSFYRVNVLKKAGYLDESLTYVMDYDLWIRLLKISEIKFIDQILAKFRLHEESKSVSQREGFMPEIHKVILRHGGSIEALPNEYLKENFYDYWIGKLKPIIEKAFQHAKDKNIGIYGIGGHTRGMLDFYRKNIGEIDFKIYFFDSNEANWGTYFYDETIRNPEEINLLNLNRIIISSFTFQEEIYEKVQNLLINNVPIIKLYNDPYSNVYFK